MPDDIRVVAGVGDDTTAPKVATDEIGLKHYQKVKAGWGVDGTWVETTDTDGNRFPVGGSQIGVLTEAAPPNDTAASGLNGRLQRVAQRLTSLMGQLPVLLGPNARSTSLAVTLANDEPQNTLIGPISETMPAADTGTTSGLNGRLQRIANNQATLLGQTNETAPSTDTAASGLNARLQRIAQRLTTLIGVFPATLGGKTASGSFAVTLASDDPQNTLIGAVTETAPANDTASSGLNGRLKRVAQNLTTLTALLPTALTPAGALKDGSAEAVLTASVAVGASVSAVVDLSGLRNWGILVPSTFDGTTIQFQMSDLSAGTFVDCYDITNTIVSMTVAAGRYYDAPGELMAIRFLKIRCATLQATTTTDFLIIGKS